uniref:Uncharacterized protein n=1 Tax=Glyptapanteles indiensis TaxID=92994 RepID=B7S937_GLYIN|nr:conserved hypothetical protein [Glyptapanteles indiensis]
MDNRQPAFNPINNSASWNHDITKVYTDVCRQKSVSSTQDYKSSITDNNSIDAKRQSRDAINQSDRFGLNSLFDESSAKLQTPCLVTERVSRQLRPIFKEAAEALQKYVAEHSRKN